MSQAFLEADWATLDRLSLSDYGIPLSELLAGSDRALVFRRVGRLFGAYLKEPFAQNLPYDLELPSNWARASRCREIHTPPSAQIIDTYESQFALLETIAIEWNRPVQFIAEYNVFLWLCRRFRPIICGEDKAFESSEKIAKDLEKKGIDASIISVNQGLGIAAATIASHLTNHVPVLANHSPIVTGAMLLILCLGQRKACKLMTDFEATYDKSKDRFATHEFYVCGSTNTRDAKPCLALVRTPGKRCMRHA
jgi:hypothetical protein